ncbi:MAG: serine hydrolase [Gemmatimonas sp.]|nr:serine hydrolase [Gemmatimonas sp.]
MHRRLSLLPAIMFRTPLAVAALLLPSIALAQTPATTRGVAASPTTARRGLSATEEAALDVIFRKAYPANAPGATVLIARGDAVLYRKAFGMADIELRVPMRPENVLQLASITKQFTSVAILMLMEQGKLNLQDPLSKYVAGFTRGDEITVHHLLNHSSGLTSYTNLHAFREKTREDLTPTQIAEYVKPLPLEFAPGSQYAYSNTGYLLLGMIIEQLSGMPYGDFIQKRIFEPLGMAHSTYASNYAIVPNRASGYQLFEGAFEKPDYLSPSIAYAAGSLLSTVDDMLRWNRAVRQNTLISEGSKQLAWTNHRLSDGRFSNYGYGWAINELAGAGTVEHTGGINGYATSGVYVPSRDVYAIVLTNRDDGSGPESNNLRAVSQVLGAPVVEKAALVLNESQLKRWVGTYRFDDVVRIVTFENGSLYSAREGGRPIRLVPLSEHRFRFENRLSTYDFAVVDGQRQARYTDRIIKTVGKAAGEAPVPE